MNEMSYADPEVSTPLSPSAEERNQYQFIVDASSELMTLIDRNYRYVTVNRAYCEAHRRDCASIIGKTVEDIWGSRALTKRIKPHHKILSLLVQDRFDKEIIESSPAFGKQRHSSRPRLIK